MSLILVFARNWMRRIACCGTERRSASSTRCAMACLWHAADRKLRYAREDSIALSREMVGV
jgi:hypothetical protein